MSLYQSLRAHKIISAISLVIAIVSISLVLMLRQNNVDYVPLRYGDVVEAIYGLGKVKTNKLYEVKLGVPAAITRLYVKEGDEVRRGDRLVSLEGDTLFSAPFQGTITRVAFYESQLVFPQQTILRLENLDDKFIEVSLEQQGALRVETGQRARVIFESLRGEQLQGRVTSLFPRNDEFLVHINVDGLKKNVLPGMSADIAIEIGKKTNVRLVPLAAIQHGHIRILREGKKQVVPLVLGNIDGNWAEVLEGDIKDDDQIIVLRRR